MDKKVLSVHELSDYLGISCPKAYELVNTGAIKSVKVGTRIIVPIENVEKFLNVNKKDQ